MHFDHGGDRAQCRQADPETTETLRFSALGAEPRHSHSQLGESLTMIGRILGHSKVGTTACYAHLVHDAEKAAAARTGDSIGARLVPEAPIRRHSSAALIPSMSTFP